MHLLTKNNQFKDGTATVYNLSLLFFWIWQMENKNQRFIF